MTDEAELDLSAGMVPHHPAGDITAFDHDSGLPIVKRKAGVQNETKTFPQADTPLPVTIPPTPADAQEIDTTPRSPATTYETKTFASGAKPVIKPAGMGDKGGDRPALKKGDAVRLADGSNGRVAHLVTNMRTVRVRTDDGKNVTVRLDSLKSGEHNAIQPADYVLVKQHFRSAPSRTGDA
jgi:hypothetical protein